MPETSLSPQAGLEVLDYAVILIYMLTTFGIAVWFGQKQKDTDDFFVGGRRMPWFAVGLSILATLFSTLSYLGGPGEMIKHGIGLFIGNLAIPFSMAVVFFLWIPFFMRLRVTSAYEYLERRFNYTMRLTGALLFILLRLGWMSMVVYAASLALDRVKGDDLAFLPGPDIYWWIFGVGIFAALYTSVGGIQAMIWTDVLQCFLLLAGVLMTIGYIVFVDQTTPVDWIRTAAEATPEHVGIPLVSFDVTVRNTVLWMIVGNFFWTICTHGSDQVVLQRYFSTASAKMARRSYLINVGVDLTMSGLLSLCGLALLAFYLKHPTNLPDGWTAVGAADKLFPHFLGHQLPTGCAGLIIAAFICDAMQTLESGVNSITAVATNDIVPRLRSGRPRIFSELTFARVMTVLITAIVTSAAFFVTDLAITSNLTLISMMPKFFNLVVGPLAALFVIGMFLRRCTARSAFPAVILGLFVAVNWSWYGELYGPMKVDGPAVAVAKVETPTTGKAAGTSAAPSAQADVKVTATSTNPTQPVVKKDPPVPTPFLAICVPWMTTIFTALLLSVFVENGRPHHGWNYTWFSVVKGSPDTDKETPPAEEGVTT